MPKSSQHPLPHALPVREAAAPAAHPVIANRARLDRRRRFLRDVVLRPFGFGLLVKPTVTGRERIPSSGPLIVIMNHIAAIDPFVVAGIMRNRPLVPMSKIENVRHPIVGLIGRVWGVYPVRRGEVDRQALATTLELLRLESAVLIAPEGTRSAAMSEAKDGTTYLATKANATIVPIGLDGTDRFPSTLLRMRRTPVTVHVGRAFRFRTEGRARIPRDELHQMTVEMMYQIAQLVPEHRRGVYDDLARMTTGTLVFEEN